MNLNWTENDERRKRWLFNYMQTKKPNLNYNSFIEDNKEELFITISFNDDWGPSSKEALYFLVAKVLKLSDPIASEVYSGLGYCLKSAREKEEKKNELDDKEKINFKPYDYFLKILNDPLKSSDHNSFLLLNLLIKQPPLRTSFYSSAKIIHSDVQNDGKNNFVLIDDKNDGKIFYIVNEDKVNKYANFKNKNNKIEILDPSLKNVIKESFKKYPRTFLFEINQKPPSNNSLLRWLRNITGLPNINFDMLRSIYVTNYHNKNKQYEQKEHLADTMRHSITTASKNYFKINDDVNEEEIAKLTQEETDKQAIKNYNKRRGDILYKLNKGDNAKESTIKKYNILFNKALKKYY
jgi:predicted RNA-binding protein YlxR (DUF448 family)